MSYRRMPRLLQEGGTWGRVHHAGGTGLLCQDDARDLPLQPVGEVGGRSVAVMEDPVGAELEGLQ